jgi:hypothetical protein
MGRHKLFYEDMKPIRDMLNEAVDLAELVHLHEQRLIEKLHVIDRRKYYVRFGNKSLSGFCRDCLRFTRTQTQRIVTRVRRFDPTAKTVDEHKDGFNRYGEKLPVIEPIVPPWEK